MSAVDSDGVGAGERIAYLPGVFDMFHIGHLKIIRNARALCDRLIVGVVSDERAEIAKGQPPVVPLAERLEIVRSIRHADDAVVEDVGDKREMWRRIGFTMIVKGDDWKGTAKGDKLESDFAPLGVEIVYLPYTVHTSSTLLRQGLQRIVSGF
jgi:glycerol-3-phosphate cytidylyltransferase